LDNNKLFCFSSLSKDFRY